MFSFFGYISVVCGSILTLWFCQLEFDKEAFLMVAWVKMTSIVGGFGISKEVREGELSFCGPCGPCFCLKQ